MKTDEALAALVDETAASINPEPHRSIWVNLLAILGCRR